MDVLTWINGITAFANLLKAWLDARKSGLDLHKAREAATKASAENVEFSVGRTEKELASQLVIDETLLAAYEKDIRQAQDRFIRVINNPRSTPAQLDQEKEIARVSICKHLRAVRELNSDQLGSAALERIWESWKCESL